MPAHTSASFDDTHAARTIRTPFTQMDNREQVREHYNRHAIANPNFEKVGTGHDSFAGCDMGNDDQHAGCAGRIATPGFNHCLESAFTFSA